MTRSTIDAILRDPGRALVEVDRELVRRGGLAEFAKLAWPVVEPADALRWNWHHDAICEHVQAVLERRLRNLLINVPPGFTKSMLVSVLASAYAWTVDPTYRVLAVSYADRLAKRDSRKVRNLLQSSWYRERWGDKFQLTKEDEARLENDRSGFRIVGSTGAGIVGERGNLVLVDDPLSREHAESEAHRKAASEFFWETLPTRLNDFQRDGKIVIMQRLHESDTSGEILARASGSWESLVLPNEFEGGRRCSTSLGFRDPRAAEGELLHPERFGPDSAAEMRTTLGAYAYAGQFQQRPAPREGGLIKVAWLARRFRERGAKPTSILQSWDCASKPAERNDPSACLTVAEFPDHLELWHASVERQEFPDLLRRAKDLAAAWKPNAVLVEDKDAGQQLIQTLKRDTKLPVVAVDPEGLDKYTRMAAEAPTLEAGNLWLPDPLALANCEWVEAFIHQLTTFPGAAHDDMVDALSQLLKWRRRKRPPGRWAIGDLSRASPNRPD